VWFSGVVDSCVLVSVDVDVVSVVLDVDSEGLSIRTVVVSNEVGVSLDGNEKVKVLNSSVSPVEKVVDSELKKDDKEEVSGSVSGSVLETVDSFVVAVLLS